MNKLQRFILAFTALLSLGAGLAWATNYALTEGSGKTFGSIVIGGTVNYPQLLLCDLTTPTQCAAVTATGGQIVDVATSNNQLHADLIAAIPSCGATPCTNHIGAVEVASGGVASGAVASGAFASGSIASGAVASGAIASGAIASGAVASGAIASGAYATGSFGNVAATKAASTAPAAADLALVVNQSPNTADPCSFANAKSMTPISMTGATPIALVPVSGSKAIYICSLSLIASGATVFSVAEGTKNTAECDTAATGVIGAATATHGLSLAANGGLTYGSGGGTIGKTAGSHELCLFQSGTGDISGNLTYVQQ